MNRSRGCTNTTCGSRGRSNTVEEHRTRKYGSTAADAREVRTRIYLAHHVPRKDARRAQLRDGTIFLRPAFSWPRASLITTNFRDTLHRYFRANTVLRPLSLRCIFGIFLEFSTDWKSSIENGRRKNTKEHWTVNLKGNRRAQFVFTDRRLDVARIRTISRVNRDTRVSRTNRPRVTSRSRRNYSRFPILLSLRDSELEHRCNPLVVSETSLF